jgi:hypothetical protein
MLGSARGAARAYGRRAVPTATCPAAGRDLRASSLASPGSRAGRQLPENAARSSKEFSSEIVRTWLCIEGTSRGSEIRQPIDARMSGVFCRPKGSAPPRVSRKSRENVPSLKVAFADGGYRGEVKSQIEEETQMQVVITLRSDTSKKGFQPLSIRWIG